jgi:hypothetical protein
MRSSYVVVAATKAIYRRPNYVARITSPELRRPNYVARITSSENSSKPDYLALRMPSKPVALRRKLRPRSFRGPFGKQPIQVEHFWRCSEASEYSIKEAQASENPISEMRWLFRGHLPALFSGTTTGCESGCPGSGESTSRRRALARFEQVSTKRPSHT